MKHRISGPFWLLILGILLLLHPHCAAASTDRYFGVDVSQHQGYIDWDTVKSNVDFVIIRCGFGGNYSAYDDTYWEYNASACDRLGIPYGVYLYSYMENESEAMGEADHVIRLLSDHNPSLPIYLDLEDATVSGLSNNQIIQYTNLWCSRIRNAGYTPGVYANYNWWTNRLGGLTLDSKYKWLAAWSNGYETIAKSYAFWQYTDNGSVPGISGRVDCNYCWDISAWANPTPVFFTISYDANDGDGAPDSHNNSGYISTIQPSRTGYDFLGWHTDRNATNGIYHSGDTCPSNINLDLYAIWIKKQFTISFDADGGTPVESVIIDYGDMVLALPRPIKRGYTFQGWYANNTPFSETTVITQDMHLIAHWSEIQLNTLNLSKALTAVEDEAFYGSTANIIIIPSGVSYIGLKAFANNLNLHTAIVHSRTVTPAVDTFADCPNLIIYGYEDTPIHYYAIAKKIPFVALSDGWVQESKVPLGATITEEKWTYTQVAESFESVMMGWEQTGTDWKATDSGVSKFVVFPAGFDAGNALYTKYNPANRKTANETSTTKTVLGEVTSTGYIYWHWTLDGTWASEAANAGKALNVYISDKNGPDSDGYTYTRFNAFEVNGILHPVYGTNTSNNDIDLSGDGIYSTCHHSEYNLPEYVSHWWWIAEIQQQPYTIYEKVYTFSRDRESTTEIQPGDGITNVHHLVRYRLD